MARRVEAIIGTGPQAETVKLARPERFSTPEAFAEWIRTEAGPEEWLQVDHRRERWVRVSSMSEIRVVGAPAPTWGRGDE